MSQAKIVHEGIEKSPSFQRQSTTPNEPISKASIPAPTPLYTRPVPMSLSMGNASDLSYIYEGGKLTYVQLYNKDYDRVVRVKYEDYQSTIGASQVLGAQSKAKGSTGSGAPLKNKVQNVLNGVRSWIASIMDKIKHIGTP